MNNIINDIKIEIICSDKVPEEYLTEMFEIEKNEFINKYKMCPKNKDEFIKRYSEKKLTIILLKYNKNIIGYGVFERINNEQIQSMIMIIHKKYRGFGLANILCALSVEYFKCLDYKYIGSWTHWEITASKIMSKYAPYICVDRELSDIEIELQKELFKYRGRERQDIFTRKYPEFYKMVDQKQNGDAFFWVHKLS